MLQATKRYDKQDILNRTDIVQLIESCGVPLTRAGRRYKACCPFHEEKTPSFIVDPERQQWHCFGACGEGGDAFDFLMKREGLSFYQALQRLADDTGARPRLTSPEPPRPRLAPRFAPPDPAWSRTMTGIARHAERNLWKAQGAAMLDYARQRIDAGRNLPRTQVDALIRAMHWGYLPSWINTGIQDTGEPINLPPGLVMPWISGGDLTALQIRPTAPGHAKYYFARGSRPGLAPYLVGGTFADNAPTFITESAIKAAAAAVELPGWNCIGMGSVTFDLPEPLIERLRRCPVVYLAMDNDPHADGTNPGQAANERLAAAIDSPNIRLCAIPFGKDVDGFIAQGGRLADLLAAATGYAPPIPDSWRTALNRYTHSVGLVVDLYTEARRALLIPGDGATVAELAAAAQVLGRDCAPSLIRRALAEATKGDFFTKLPGMVPISDRVQEPEPGKNVNKSRGRLPDRYQFVQIAKLRTAILRAARDVLADEFALAADAVPPITARHVDQALDGENPDPDMLHPEAEPIARELNDRHGEAITAQPGSAARADRLRFALSRLEHQLDRLTSTPLPTGWRWESVGRYKACFLRALHDANRLTDAKGRRTDAPGRGRLAEITGTSVRGVLEVAKNAGLGLTAVKVEKEIRDAGTILALPSYDPALGAKPLYLEYPGGHGLAWDQETRRAAAQQADAGQPIRVVYQAASRVHAVSDTQPIRARVQRAVPSDVVSQPPALPTPAPVPAEPEAVAPETVPAPSVLKLNRGLLVLVKLLALVSAWRLQDGALLDTSTGEIVPFRPRTVIALLRGEPTSPPGPLSPPERGGITPD